MTLLILDFDGVVVDSEVIANHALAHALNAIGLPTTLDESLEWYMGRRWDDCAVLIEERLGGPLPAGFVERRRAEIRNRVALRLEAVPGVAAFLDAHPGWRRCIASSSSHEWIELCLQRVGLAERFAHRFSGATDVANGKPAPDLFLHAAATMGSAPAECVVIEDSVSGVRAGVAAGMLTVGLTAGSHAGPAHAAKLRAAGAEVVAQSWHEVGAILEERPSPYGQGHSRRQP